MEKLLLSFWSFSSHPKSHACGTICSKRGQWHRDNPYVTYVTAISRPIFLRRAFRLRFLLCHDHREDAKRGSEEAGQPMIALARVLMLHVSRVCEHKQKAVWFGGGWSLLYLLDSLSYRPYLERQKPQRYKTTQKQQRGLTQCKCTYTRRSLVRSWGHQTKSNMY